MEEDVEIYDGVKEDASKASIHTNPNTENVRKLLWFTDCVIFQVKLSLFTSFPSIIKGHAWIWILVGLLLP